MEVQQPELPPFGGDRELTVSVNDLLDNVAWPGEAITHVETLKNAIDTYNGLQGYVSPDLTVSDDVLMNMNIQLKEAFTAVVELGKTAHTFVKLVLEPRILQQMQLVAALVRIQPMKSAPPPRVLHFYWSGDALRTEAADNINAWARLARRDGWTLNVWTDKVRAGWVKGAKLEKNVSIQFVDVSVIDPRLWTYYEQLVPKAVKPNYPAGSDIARYSILLKGGGGVYVDVDISPGRLHSLDEFAVPLRFPLLGPQTRDTQSVREFLRLPKEFLVVPAHIERCGRLMQAKGVHNNAFIICPTNNAPMDTVVVEVASELSRKMEGLLLSPDNAAMVTGPGPVKAGFFKFVAKELKVDVGEATSYVTLLMNRNLPLAWLTPESERQEH